MHDPGALHVPEGGIPRIRVEAFGSVPGQLLAMLERELPRRFGGRVETVCRGPIGAAWTDSERGQVRADALLDAMIAEADRPEPWRLALVDGDLFAPGLRSAFGHATLGGCCAVVGLARLRPDPDRDTDAALFERRVLTEAVHELGHVAGLNHCPDADCVMHVSDTLADTDRKGPDFCDLCAP